MTSTNPDGSSPLVQLPVQITGTEGAPKAAYTVLKEHILTVIVNGQPLRTIVCTRGDLLPMAVGHLFTAGRIGSADQLKETELSPDETHVRITADGELSRPLTLRPIEAEPVWEDSWVYSLAARLREGMPLYRQTGAAHCAFLSRGGRLLYACEDISRHNAVDKVIGHALLGGVDLTKCMLFTSGRVPADMVEKAVVSSIPVLVSKAAPTADAVEMAQRFRLKLICCAREDSYIEFS